MGRDGESKKAGCVGVFDSCARKTLRRGIRNHHQGGKAGERKKGNDLGEVRVLEISHGKESGFT